MSLALERSCEQGDFPGMYKLLRDICRLANETTINLDDFILRG